MYTLPDAYLGSPSSTALKNAMTTHKKGMHQIYLNIFLIKKPKIIPECRSIHCQFEYDTDVLLLQSDHSL